MHIDGGLHMSGRVLIAILCASVCLAPTLLPSPVAAQSVQRADSSKPLIQLRLGRASPAPGFDAMTNPRTNRVIHVSRVNLFSDSDFVGVSTTASPDGLVLNARFKADAAGRWARMLRGELGAANAYLAVFIDGELVEAPVLVVRPRATPPASVAIGVPGKSDKAKRITAAVAARWPKGER
jgi:hypothetical protein